MPCMRQRMTHCGPGLQVHDRVSSDTNFEGPEPPMWLPQMFQRPSVRSWRIKSAHPSKWPIPWLPGICSYVACIGVPFAFHIKGFQAGAGSEPMTWLKVPPVTCEPQIHVLSRCSNDVSVWNQNESNIIKRIGINSPIHWLISKHPP